MESVKEMMEAGDLVGLRRQLKEKPDLLSMKDDEGYSLLYHANNTDIAQILLDAGASPSLHTAAEKGNSHVVMLLAPLSDVNLVGTSSFLLLQNLAMATKPSSVSGEPWPDSLAQRRQCGDRTGSTGQRRLPHHPG